MGLHVTEVKKKNEKRLGIFGMYEKQTKSLRV